MAQVVALFNRTHPHLHVTLSNPVSGGGYAKYYNAVKAGDPPDLAHIEFDQLPAFKAAGDLVAVGQYANKYQNQYAAWTWRQGVMAGETDAIPWATGSLGFFYRSDLLPKYGITSPPTTWAQFEADAVTVHKANPNVYMSYWAPNEGKLFASLAWQAGAKWFNAGSRAWTVKINSPATQRVATYWETLIRRHLVKVEPDWETGWYNDLEDGTILSLPEPQWFDATLRSIATKSSGDWRVAPVPTWSASHPTSGNYGGSSLAVLRGAKNPAGAIYFAHWMTTNPQAINIWVSSGDGWPAAKDTRGVTSLSAKVPFYGGQNINSVFAKMNTEVNESWQWSPVTQQTYTAFNDAFNSVATGAKTINQAVKSAQQQSVSDLKNMGISVRR